MKRSFRLGHVYGFLGFLLSPLWLPGLAFVMFRSPLGWLLCVSPNLPLAAMTLLAISYFYFIMGRRWALVTQIIFLSLVALVSALGAFFFREHILLFSAVCLLSVGMVVYLGLHVELFPRMGLSNPVEKSLWRARTPQERRVARWWLATLIIERVSTVLVFLIAVLSLVGDSVEDFDGWVQGLLFSPVWVRLFAFPILSLVIWRAYFRRGTALLFGFIIATAWSCLSAPVLFLAYNEDWRIAALAGLITVGRPALTYLSYRLRKINLAFHTQPEGMAEQASTPA